MATNETINQLPTASTIDATQDILPIYTASSNATQGINRNTLLGISSVPIGLTDTQTLTNKTLTSPTISSPTLSGTIAGTYTIGGTPTFPSSVVQLTSSQTLANKTLTSPTINSPTITNATISADTLSGYTVSTNGTVYGMSVTGGILASAALVGTVNTAAIASGIQLPDKMKNPYKFSVYRSTNQTVTASTLTKIQFDAKAFDTGSNFDNSTNYRFIAPISGFYFFSANATNNGNGIFNLTIYKNGTAWRLGIDINPATNLSAGPVSDLMQLNANDYVEIFVSSANTTIVGGTGPSDTYFSGFLVSAT